jgi:hypothetical protein
MEANMTRLFSAALVTVLLSSTAALARQPHAVSPTSFDASTATAGQMSNGQRCASLRQQWTDAAQARQESPRLGQAKSMANMARNLCRSTNAGDVQKGVDEYLSALKLLGVQPS